MSSKIKAYEALRAVGVRADWAESAVAGFTADAFEPGVPLKTPNIVGKARKTAKAKPKTFPTYADRDSIVKMLRDEDQLDWDQVAKEWKVSRSFIDKLWRDYQNTGKLPSKMVGLTAAEAKTTKLLRAKR